MNKTRVSKKADVDDDTNIVKIIFVLVNADGVISFSDIVKQTNLPSNLVSYHLKNLKDKHIVLETNGGYRCQPFLNDENVSEDLDSLMTLIIKTMAREMIIKEPTMRELSTAVIENLKLYVELFDLES